MFSVVSVILLCAAAFLAVRNWVCRSPYRMMYGGRPYAFESKEVEGFIQKVEWSAENGYVMTCQVNGVDAEVCLPASRAVHHGRRPDSSVGRAIQLIAIQLSGQTAYVDSGLRYPQAESAPAQVTDKAAIYSERANAANILGGVVWLVSWLLVVSTPVLAIAGGLASMGLWYTFRPFWDWKNNPKCCIIKNKKKEEKVLSGTGEVSAEAALPLGYDYWSLCRKELYDIEMRTGGQGPRPEEESLAASVAELEEIPTVQPDIPQAPEMDAATMEVFQAAYRQGIAEREAAAPQMEAVATESPKETTIEEVPPQSVEEPANPQNNASAEQPPSEVHTGPSEAVDETSPSDDHNQAAEKKSQPANPAKDSHQSGNYRNKGRKAKRRRYPSANAGGTDVAKVLGVVDTTSAKKEN